MYGKFYNGVKSKKESKTEVEEMNQQQRMRIMADVTRNIKAKGRIEAKNGWWVSERLGC